MICLSIHCTLCKKTEWWWRIVVSCCYLYFKVRSLEKRVQPTPGAFQTAFSLSLFFFALFLHNHEDIRCCLVIVSGIRCCCLWKHCTMSNVVSQGVSVQQSFTTAHSTFYTTYKLIPLYKQLLYTYHGCHWAVYCWQRWRCFYHLVFALSRHLRCQAHCCRWPTWCMYCITVCNQGKTKVFHIDPCQWFLAFRILCCYQGTCSSQ